MAASTPSGDKLEDAGLNSRADGSICILRRPGMYDYVAAVEDLSARDIGNAWEILRAFRGISKVWKTHAVSADSFGKDSQSSTWTLHYLGKLTNRSVDQGTAIRMIGSHLASLRLAGKQTSTPKVTPLRVLLWNTRNLTKYGQMARAYFCVAIRMG